MIKNPTEEQMKNSLCRLCHWKEDGKYLCHAVEPPREINVAITAAGDCCYIPSSYWNRIPQEQKDEFNKDVIERSKRFYKIKDPMKKEGMKRSSELLYWEDYSQYIHYDEKTNSYYYDPELPERARISFEMWSKQVDS